MITIVAHITNEGTNVISDGTDTLNTLKEGKRWVMTGAKR